MASILLYAFVNERHDSCCQALTIACFSSAIDVNCDVGVTSSKQTMAPFLAHPVWC